MAALKDRYANALIELSQEASSLEEDLKGVSFLMNWLEDADAQGFIADPYIRDEEKYKLFEDAFSGKISNRLLGFLYLMVRKNRESLILSVLREYAGRLNRLLGKIEAKVVSAKTLTEGQLSSIRAVLSKQMGNQVEISASVDPNVIGGFYVLAEGRIFDGTVRSNLNLISANLKERGL